MPELPEVEILARQIQKKISGFVIREVVLLQNVLVAGSPETIKDKLPGKKITNLSRRGKFLCLKLEGNISLWIHLGMTGQLFLRSKPENYDKHAHLVLRFNEVDEEFIFSDIRKFGKICLSNGSYDSIPEGIRRLGPEPFDLSEEEFTRVFKTRKGRIKNLLLNQKLLAGLGNIYADESLFRAGIDPRKRSHQLNRTRLKELHEAICQTLTRAIEKGGSSIDDFFHVNGESGKFQNFHQVYGRKGKKCSHCGSLIRRIRLAGRSAHFCPNCQK